jgi:hypothetical protein
VDGLTTILVVVAPVFQIIVPAQLLAVRVVLSPTQILGLDATTVGAGPVVVTVILILFDLTLTQSPTLHTAVYSVVDGGVTTIVLPVILFDQRIVPSHVPTALSVTLCPAQSSVESAEIIGAVGFPTVTVIGADGLLTHCPTVHVAVYVVVAVGLTTMLAPTA